MAKAGSTMALIRSTPRLGYAVGVILFAGGGVAGAKWSAAVRNKRLGAGILRAYRNLVDNNSDSDDEGLDDEGNPTRNAARVNLDFVRNLASFVRICVPGVRTREAAMVAAIAVLLGARSWLDLWTSSNGGNVVRAIVSRNKTQFVKYAIRDIGVMMFPCSFVNNSLRYSLSRLKVMWRRRMSMYFHEKYLASNTYYKIANLDDRVKNIDQLLTADVERFCSSLADLYSNVSKPSIDILLTSRKLAATLGAEGPVLMISYFMLCSAVLRSLQPPFGDLAARGQVIEGEYRLRHSRLIAHSEEIAFYGGGDREKVHINAAFDNMASHCNKLFAARWRIGIVDQILVKFLATIVGYSVVSIPIFFTDAKFLGLLLPKLLGRHRKSATPQVQPEANSKAIDSSDIAGQYTRNSRLLLQLASAIGRLVLAGKEVTRLTGFTQRVANLRDVLDDMSKQCATQRRFESSPDLQRDIELARLMKPGKLFISEEDDGPEANVVRFNGVNLLSPDLRILATNITFEIPRGQHVLLCGPNGCGKTSLFRVVRGLWPLYGGSLSRPLSMFYVPQKPYLALGTLRENITYPKSWQEAVEQHGASDASLIDLLETVHLSDLLKRKGGLDAVCDWKSSLSGGQAQRLAFSRLLFNKPAYAILDECTSQVSLDVEGILYEKAKQCGITLISVSHRPSLWKYHNKKLVFDGEGGHSFSDIAVDEIPNMLGGATSAPTTAGT